MKKRGKKKIKHSKKKIFFNKKLFAVAILSFLVFAFLLSFSNVSRTSVTGEQTKGFGKSTFGKTSFISDFFGDWGAGELDITLAKYLFWMILLLFIIGVLNFANFPPKKEDGQGIGFLRFLLALIISFLATAYITPEEVYTLLISYSALGLTLGALIPFMIIIFTSAMLVSNEDIKNLNVARYMAQVVLWLLWCGFLVYRLVKVWADPEMGFEFLLKGGGIIFLVVFILSWIALLGNRYVVKWMWGIGNRIRKAQEEAISTSEAAERKSRRETYGSVK